MNIKITAQKWLKSLVVILVQVHMTVTHSPLTKEAVCFHQAAEVTLSSGSSMDNIGGYM